MRECRFEDDGLYNLLPSVIRHRDELSGGPLRAQLRKFGKVTDTLEGKISDSYDGFFVETCGPDELVHIADLIGYPPILGRLQPAEMVLRRDVAKTIWARRRKGTAEVLGAIVRGLTGWQTVVFENNREVVLTSSTRFVMERQSQGTPDFRKLVGRNRIDQRPGSIPRIATMRRIQSDESRGRWHPLDVVVEVRSASAPVRRKGSQNAPGERHPTIINPDLKAVITDRLSDYTPMEAQTGVIHRS